MSELLMLEIIRRALPGCQLYSFDDPSKTCRLIWAGQWFDITMCGVDDYPVWLVTDDNMAFNAHTAKALAMLDSVTEEIWIVGKPWVEVEQLIRRLRELQEEEDDNDGA